MKIENLKAVNELAERREECLEFLGAIEAGDSDTLQVITWGQYHACIYRGVLRTALERQIIDIDGALARMGVST